MKFVKLGSTGLDSQAGYVLSLLAVGATDSAIAAQTAPSVADALASIVAEDPAARVLICGSLYLAGEVLQALVDVNTPVIVRAAYQ